MKQSRFTEEQIIGILKEHGGQTCGFGVRRSCSEGWFCADAPVAQIRVSQHDGAARDLAHPRLRALFQTAWPTSWAGWFHDQP